MRLRRIAGILVLFVFGIALAQQAPPTEDKVSARLRQLYPTNVDAKKEIASAIQAAEKDHKRVLLVFGASWCFDCFALDYRFHQPEIQPILDRNYHVVHVDIGQHDKNLDIAQRYDTPVEAVPTIAVLSSSGRLLFSQKTHQFSAARSLDPQVIVKFLQTWKPTA